MKTFYIDPTEIKVNKELGRVRKDMGDLKDLSLSLEALGQIVPVIVTDNNELIDGARRVAACCLIKKEVFCVVKENLEPLEMKALELEANIKRKAFTPAEEMEGVKFLHELKAGGDKEWTLEDTGKLLGVEKSTLSKKLQLAKAIEAFPELKKLKTENEIRKAVKEIAKATARSEAVKKFEEKDDGSSSYDITVRDMVTACGNLSPNSVDILLTDPPYGIEIDKNMEGMNKLGSFSYSDSFHSAILMYETLAEESFKFVKENGHAYVFFAPELYEIVKRSFTSLGWLSNHRPIIWVKHSSGQCNQPTMWPSACYEMCMYFRKEKSKLVVEGKPDWIQFSPLSPDKKVHPSEKPVEMLRDLLNRVALPGDIVFDPFMGSGSSMEAAVLEKLVPIGSDIAQECYEMAMDRLNSLEGKNG